MPISRRVNPGLLFILLVSAWLAISAHGVADESTSNTAVQNSGASAAKAESFEQAVLPFLTKHCLRCHGETLQKGELRINTLSRDFVGGGSAMHWGDVMYRISSGEMPPPDEPQPSADEAARIADWLNARIKEGESARLAKRERVTFQKLTREEY